MAAAVTICLTLLHGQTSSVGDGGFWGQAGDLRGHRDRLCRGCQLLAQRESCRKNVRECYRSRRWQLDVGGRSDSLRPLALAALPVDGQSSSRSGRSKDVTQHMHLRLVCTQAAARVIVACPFHLMPVTMEGQTGPSS